MGTPRTGIGEGMDVAGRRHWRTALVVVLLAALGLVSCSGDGGGSADLSLAELRDKLQDADIDCKGDVEEPDEDESDFGIEVKGELECEVGDSTISMAEFKSKGDVAKAEVLIESFACEFDGEDVGYLSAGRWLVSVSDDSGNTDTELLKKVGDALDTKVKTIECDESDSSSDDSSDDSSSSDDDFSISEGDIALASGDDPLAFGDTAEWDDGITITVSEPEDFTPSEFATDTEGGDAVVFEITINNGTEENFDPSSVYPELQSGSSESSEIYDYDQLGERPSTTLLPGREVAWKVAFEVDDPDDLVMALQPSFGFEYAEAIFTNA